jgi:cation transport regulator
MAHRSTSLPREVPRELPPRAQAIFLSAYIAAKRRYQRLGKLREDVARQLAWAAVRRAYSKRGNGWIPRETGRAMT